MSRHRLDRPPPSRGGARRLSREELQARRPAPAARGGRRAEVRPRYGRIAVLGISVAVVGVALLGAGGVLPTDADAPSVVSDTAADVTGAAGAANDAPGPVSPSVSDLLLLGAPERGDVRAKQGERVVAGQDAATGADDEGAEVDTADVAGTALPAASGEGRRVVFSESRQRVWLVEPTAAGDDEVARTYLVSGSIYDNLEPGTFAVYSRSMDAVGIEDSGTMRYFVRFTQGTQGAAIGFHDIPVKDGEPLQTVDQLGTPLSHGCIRQDEADAVALWDFAPLGTTVVVTA